jgi:hypothetical protein
VARLPIPQLKNGMRAFVKNISEHQVAFCPGTLKLHFGGGVWVDGHWPTYEDFRLNESVMKLHDRGRIEVHFYPWGSDDGGGPCSFG